MYQIIDAPSICLELLSRIPIGKIMFVPIVLCNSALSVVICLRTKYQVP